MIDLFEGVSVNISFKSRSLNSEGFKKNIYYLFKYGLQISNKLSPTFPIKDLKLNSIYKYIYKLKRSIYCCYIPVEPHQRPHHISFFLFSIIFIFPLSLPQIQLGLSVFFVSLFSINCAFSMSFLVTIKIEKVMGALFCWYVKKSYAELIGVAQ